MKAGFARLIELPQRSQPEGSTDEHAGSWLAR
jgi:hypothetical protein